MEGREGTRKEKLRDTVGSVELWTLGGCTWGQGTNGWVTAEPLESYRNSHISKE